MIPHNQPSMSEQEAFAAQQVIQSGYLVKGAQIHAFEQEICEFMGLPSGHAVCVSSGSSALFIALNILKLQKKKIAFPSYVCSSLKHACSLNQSEPVYLDNNKYKITPKFDSVQFDALIYPYLYGLSSELPEFECPIIEDVAQAMGAKVNNTMLGTQGTLGVLSFYATKMMTSGGQGGMLISKNKELIDLARDYIQFDQRHDTQACFNFHITEMQAAIARVQLKRLPEFIQKRQEIWQIYQAAELPLLDNPGKGLNHVRYRAIIKHQDANKIIATLNSQGITAINPFEKSELLSNNAPNAKALCGLTCSLPIYPNLSIEHAHYIAQKTKEALSQL